MSDRPRDPAADPDEPGLPQLRRFRFTEGEVPGRRSADAPAAGPEPSAAHEDPALSDPSSLSDTFDVADLEYDDPEPTRRDPRGAGEWRDTSSPAAPSYTPPPPAWGSPGTGPVATPGTGPLPAAAEPKRSRGLLVGVAAFVVVVLAVVAVLVFKPFSSDDTTQDAAPGTPPPATVAPSDGGGSAPASPTADASGGDRAEGSPSGGAVMPAGFAGSLCTTVLDYQDEADTLVEQADTAASSTTGAAAMDTLQTKASDLLTRLADDVQALDAATPSDGDLQKTVASTATQAAQALTSGSKGQPDVQADLIAEQLQKPVTVVKAEASEPGSTLGATTACADVVQS